MCLYCSPAVVHTRGTSEIEERKSFAKLEH